MNFSNGAAFVMLLALGSPGISEIQYDPPAPPNQSPRPFRKKLKEKNRFAEVHILVEDAKALFLCCNNTIWQRLSEDIEGLERDMWYPGFNKATARDTTEVKKGFVYVQSLRQDSLPS